MKRRDFQELAALRLKEAKLLLKGDCPEGAYYVAGYAAECALKACIAKRTQRHDFPDLNLARNSWQHGLPELIKAAGLDEELKLAKRIRQFDANWTVVTKWKPDSRYERRSVIEARGLIEALGDRKDGVMRWLKRHW